MTQNASPQEPDSTKMAGKVMMYIAWAFALGLLTWFFDIFEDYKINPNQSPSHISSEKINEVILQRNAYGHYVTTGTINGKEVTFLLDTGATNVSVPEKLAGNLKLEKKAQGKSSTANGYVNVFFTRINEIRIGSIVAYDVPASINPGMNHSNQILLGMSVLKHVEFAQKGSTLTLRQKRP